MVRPRPRTCRRRAARRTPASPAGGSHAGRRAIRRGSREAAARALSTAWASVLIPLSASDAGLGAAPRPEARVHCKKTSGRYASGPRRGIRHEQPRRARPEHPADPENRVAGHRRGAGDDIGPVYEVHPDPVGTRTARDVPEGHADRNLDIHRHVPHGHGHGTDDARADVPARAGRASGCGRSSSTRLRRPSAGRRIRCRR